MTGGVVVRHLGEDDWRRWRQLRRAALAQAPEAFGSTLARWSGDGDREERWRAHLRDVALHLVAEVEGEPVGLVAATAPGADGVVELISLWVDPAARGTGCGDALVAGVLTWAAAEHPGVPVELSVREAGVAARRLYARHGFVGTGTRPDDGCDLRLRRTGVDGRP